MLRLLGIDNISVRILSTTLAFFSSSFRDTETAFSCKRQSEKLERSGGNTELIMSTKDSAAVCYSQTSVFQRDDGMKLLEQLSPEKGDQILDLGSGTGYLANALAERVGPEGKVIAVDLDSERINVARECYGSNNNLKFLVASDKDFPVCEYDIVFSTDVIHWIEDKNATFKRVYDNLKPGGCFGFTTLDNPTWPNLLTQFVELFGPQTVKATLGSWHFQSAGEYEHIATSIGFEVTSMVVKKQSYTCPNIDFFIDHFYGVFQGKFDRSSAALDELKRQYEGQPIVMVLPRLTAILTKPLPNT